MMRDFIKDQWACDAHYINSMSKVYDEKSTIVVRASFFIFYHPLFYLEVHVEAYRAKSQRIWVRLP